MEIKKISLEIEKVEIKCNYTKFYYTSLANESSLRVYRQVELLVNELTFAGNE